jgi:hypothetical protein
MKKETSIYAVGLCSEFFYIFQIETFQNKLLAYEYSIFPKYYISILFAIFFISLTPWSVGFRGEVCQTSWVHLSSDSEQEKLLLNWVCSILVNFSPTGKCCPYDRNFCIPVLKKVSSASCIYLYKRYMTSFPVAEVWTHRLVINFRSASAAHTSTSCTWPEPNTKKI